MATETTTIPRHHDDRTPAAPPPSPPRKRRSLFWLWLLLLAAAGYGGYRFYAARAGQAKKPGPDAAQGGRMAPRAVPVLASPARLGDIPVFVRGLGNVAPLNNVVVKSRVDGQLIAVHFTEGQFVNKGALLAEIDPRPFEVQLQQAQGQLAKDQAALNDAKVNLARYQKLAKDGVIPRQQLDTQAAAVGQAEGVIESDQASINSAKLQLTYAHITAPLSGRVGLRQVDVGNMIHATDANGLVSIAQMQPIAVLFTIPADNLPPILQKLRAGVKMRVDAYDRDDKNELSTGTLLTVDNQIDPQTGTSRLKAVFDNRAGELFPNQFVNCRLLLDTRRNVVIVPSPAVQRGPQGTYLFVVAPDGVAKMRTVNITLTEGGDVAADNVQPGEMVVVDGQDKLQDGSKVDVRTLGGGPGKRKRPSA